MIKAIWILAIGGAIAAGAIWGLRGCTDRGWERTLSGPFAGAPFSGNLTMVPSSVLEIPGRGRLEVYELSPPTNPVVVLRSSGGAVEWSRLMVPMENRDGQLEPVGLRELRLHRQESRSTGFVVLVACDWDRGGKERGLIDLDREYRFRSFRLSW